MVVWGVNVPRQCTVACWLGGGSILVSGVYTDTGMRNTDSSIIGYVHSDPRFSL
jgi:hypothetical protein